MSIRCEQMKSLSDNGVFYKRFSTNHDSVESSFNNLMMYHVKRYEMSVEMSHKEIVQSGKLIPFVI